MPAAPRSLLWLVFLIAVAFKKILRFGWPGCPLQAFPNDYVMKGNAMKYLCSVFFDEKQLDALSEKEHEKLDEESLAYDDLLRKDGHFLAAQALQPVEAAATLRVRGGKVTVTDGPFAETREQIGGFLLIEARDLNEAIQLASRIPVIRLGGIEVRPIKEITRRSGTQ